MVGWLWHRRGKSQERGVLGIGFSWGSIEQTASLSSESSATGEQIVTPTPNLEQGIHGVSSPLVFSLPALSFSTATGAFGHFWLRSVTMRMQINILPMCNCNSSSLSLTCLLPPFVQGSPLNRSALLPSHLQQLPYASSHACRRGQSSLNQAQ